MKQYKEPRAGLERVVGQVRAAIDDGSFGPPLFWAWNCVFIAFVLLGFVPVALVGILSAAQAADIAPDYVIWSLAIVMIPVFSVYVAHKRLGSRPEALYALFYGVEAPLMLLASVRLFLLQDLPAHAAMLYAASLIGIAALAFEILSGRKATDSRAVHGARLAGLTVLTVTGFYVAAWVAFLAVPFAWFYLEFAGEIFGSFASAIRNLTWDALRGVRLGELMLLIMGVPLSLFTASLFIASPVLVPALYVRRWLHAARSLAARSGAALPAGISVVVVAAWVGLYALTARQPQHAAFAALETFKSSGHGSHEARDALVSRESEIKAGLLNAYLARYRYAGVSGVYRQIEELYASAFGRQRDYTDVLSAYDRIARPFLYEPVVPAAGDAKADVEQDPVRAAQLYAAYYDEPIAQAEFTAVRDAVRSTWQADQAAANLSDIEDRDVRLASQTLTVETHGDMASIELYEEYRNRTFTEQEVFYYLTLPESAVVTGLWLGTSADKSAADVFRVSTRGAAQAVYQQQRRINRDPALMEQIGPRQYRLRIFPIPARSNNFGIQGEAAPAPAEGDSLHLWLRVTVLANNGEYPLPALTERRNVYWDDRTERSLHGVSAEWHGEEWLPSTIPSSGDVAPRAHRADFDGGKSVVALPSANSGTMDQEEVLPEDARIAIILDRSRSMANVENALLESLAELRSIVDAEALEESRSLTDVEDPLVQPAAETGAATESDAGAEPLNSDDEARGILRGREIDIVLTSSPVRGEPARIVPFESLNPEDLVFFGGMTPAELIGQLDLLREGRTYDAVLVLTDAGDFTAEADAADMPDLGAPLWLIHVGGDFPPGYPDTLQDAMRASGGGTSGSVTEALLRSNAEEGEVVDGYRWHVVDREVAAVLAPGVAPESGFEPLAARMLILDAERSARTDLAASDESARLAGLDALHALAVRSGIVTPYSSMIVLVNAQQHSDLDMLEQDDDRFGREVEDEGPDNRELALAPVTAVPEPGEWLLMALAAAAVAVMARRRWATGVAGV